MADLKKLDEIVDELGKQSEKLMNFTEIYSEISKLKDDIGVNVSSIKSSSEKLNEISEEVKTQTQELAEQLTEMKSSLQERIELIEENNKKFQREFDSDITSKLNKHSSDIEVTIRAEAKETATSIENNLSKIFPEQLSEIKTTLFKLVDQNDKLTKKTDLLSFGVLAIAAILVYKFFINV